MAIISMAVVLSITGCNQNADEDSAFQTLDIEQLETDTTDIDDRAEYYDKNVDDRIDEMTDEEKEKFYVNLTLTYTGREYYEEDYKKMPVVSQADSHILATYIFDEYNETKYKILKSGCGFHKLSTRFDDRQKLKKNTF